MTIQECGWGLRGEKLAGECHSYKSIAVLDSSQVPREGQKIGC
jgi:hypothetical protein